MDVLVTNKQLRNAFNKMMSKYDETVLVDYDMSMGSRRDPHIVQLFTTEDDKYFAQSYMGVLDLEKPIDVESSMLRPSIWKEKGPEEYPLFMYSKDVFRNEIALFADLFDPLFKNWLENKFNIKINGMWSWTYK